MMKQVMFLFMAAFTVNSCRHMQIVNKDPKARYIVASKTLEGVFRQLGRFRDNKVISNTNDWNRIKILCKEASEAFDLWGESTKSTGIKNIDFENRAMELLVNLQALEKTYEVNNE